MNELIQTFLFDQVAVFRGLFQKTGDYIQFKP